MTSRFAFLTASAWTCLNTFALANTEALTASDIASRPSSGSSSVTSRFRLPFEDQVTPSLWQWGRLKASPSLNYRIFHADGLRNRGSATRGSTIQELSPSIALSLGGNWSASYSPSWTWYNDPTLQDNVSHSFALAGSARYDMVGVSFSQDYSFSNESRVETGQQSKEENWGTQLSISFPINRYASFVNSSSQQIRFSPSFTTSREWSNTASVMFRLAPRVSVGPGFGLGYIDVDPGINTKYYRALVSGNWAIGTKLSLSGSIGLDHRMPESEISNDTTGSSHAITVLYRATKTTTVSVSKARSLGTSYFVNQSTTTDKLQVSLSQRLLSRISASVGYSIGTTKYEGLRVATGRSDDTTSWDASLSTDLIPRLSTSVFYRVTENESGLAQFSLRSTQYGLSLSYRF